jgi:hypothetical protein
MPQRKETTTSIKYKQLERNALQIVMMIKTEENN